MLFINVSLYEENLITVKYVISLEHSSSKKLNYPNQGDSSGSWNWLYGYKISKNKRKEKDITGKTFIL